MTLVLRELSSEAPSAAPGYVGTSDGQLSGRRPTGPGVVNVIGAVSWTGADEALVGGDDVVAGGDFCSSFVQPMTQENMRSVKETFCISSSCWHDIVPLAMVLALR